MAKTEQINEKRISLRPERIDKLIQSLGAIPKKQKDYCPAQWSALEHMAKHTIPRTGFSGELAPFVQSRPAAHRALRAIQYSHFNYTGTETAMTGKPTTFGQQLEAIRLAIFNLQSSCNSDGVALCDQAFNLLVEICEGTPATRTSKLAPTKKY